MSPPSKLRQVFVPAAEGDQKKPKTGDRIAAISRLVPGAGQFSNSLYANLDEFKALKESLKREGIFDETWETLVIPRRGASSTLPYRP